MWKLFILLIFQVFDFQFWGNNKTQTMPYSWFNLKYIDCIQYQLPCECEKATGTYFSLVLDTNSHSKNFGVALSEYNLMEPNIFPVRKVGIHEFEVISNNRDSSIWAKIIVERDSIYFFEKNSKSVFCQSNNSKKYDVQHYRIDNVNLINRSLNRRGYQKLETIVGYDSLACYCNKWKGKINFLRSLANPKSWVLEIKNDSLFIDFVTYPSDDPDPDDPIIPKKFRAYKWQ